MAASAIYDSDEMLVACRILRDIISTA